MGKKAWSYLCELQRGKDRNPVFVFPGGGGGEPEFFVYGFLARHVGTEYPIYGLRARGADGTLQPHTSVAQMADAYVDEIRTRQPKGPYFLVGECAGGVNAYETARQLIAQGQTVAILVLMDVERPRLTKYLHYRASKWMDPVIELPHVAIRRFHESYYLARAPLHIRRLRLLRLRDYPGYILDRIPTGRNSTAAASRRDQATAVLQVNVSGQALKHIEWVRENYRRVVRRFHPKPYEGDVAIIISETLYQNDPTLGWKKLVPKGLNIHPVSGDHFTYIREHVAESGLKLRECIERAEKKHASSPARNHAP
jgi:thioesterase domain-containing protein